MKEKNSENYISLQEATQCCNYSQEYLSLRARQGKLKAVKFGRNWVTKKEWLESYLEKVEEYNNQIAVKKIKKVEPPEELAKVIEVQPREKIRRVGPLPLLPGLRWETIRFAFSLVLIFVLLIAGGVLGKESFKNVYEMANPYVQEISQVGDLVLSDSGQSFKNVFEDLDPYTYMLGQAGDIIVEKTAKIVSDIISDSTQSFAFVAGSLKKGAATVSKTIGNQQISIEGESFTVGELGLGTLSIFKNYGQWLLDQTLVLWEKIKESPIGRSYLAANHFIEQKLGPLTLQTFEIYTRANNFLEKKLKGLSYSISRSYLAANHFVEQKLTQGIQSLKEGYFSANHFAEQKLIQTTKSLRESYLTANNFLEEKISILGDRISEGGGKIVEGVKRIGRGVVKGYLAANDLVEQKLRQGYRAITQFFTKAYQFVTQPRGVPLTKEEIMEIEEKETEKIIESVRQELQKLREEGIPVKEIIKEVKKITEVKPVKEITKEIIKIDEKALKQVRAQIVELQEEVAKRLYAPGGVVTQQIYITQPVASPKIYQENGDIVLQTAGSGNVILSAATGMQISGQQVIIDSTNILNPLVYIADKTRIGGETTIDDAVSVGGPITAQRITLNAPSTYSGNILDVQSGGTTKFSVQETGAATLVGNFTITGDLSVTGDQTLSGVVSITATSTSPALTVRQNGSGDIAVFKDGATSVFTIADGGNLTLATSPSTTTPAFLVQPADTSDWSTGTSTYFGVNATSTFSGYLVDFQKSGVSLFNIDQDGNMILAGTATAATYLSAATDSTVRKTDEEVLRGSASIFRYSLPAQTSSTTYIRVSKYFSSTSTNPLSSLPTTLPGATRVYRLVINYTDDLATSASSTWRIYRPVAATTTSTFYLPGADDSSFEEGKPYITGLVTIPSDEDWQVELKLPDATKTIRIFKIFLIAYDQIQ